MNGRTHKIRRSDVVVDVEDVGPPPGLAELLLVDHDSLPVRSGSDVRQHEDVEPDDDGVQRCQSGTESPRSTSQSDHRESLLTWRRSSPQVSVEHSQKYPEGCGVLVQFGDE